MTRYSALRLNDELLLPGADRKVNFSITPIAAAAQLRRTVNGEMVNISRPVFRKYKISISGSGRRAPAISDLFPGDLVELITPEPVYVSSINVGREVVEKFGVLESGGQLRVAPDAEFGRPVVAIGYRVKLACVVISAAVQVDEWRKEYNWNLELEER